MSVIVVGGGWAGLACAAHLSQHGFKPCVLEAGPHLGGRARSIKFGPFEVDNGQHLLMGAYQSTRALLQLLHPNSKALFQIESFDWWLQSAKHSCRLKMGTSRLSFLLGFLKAKGLSWYDKWQMVALLRKLDHIIAAPDQPVEQMLFQMRQTDNAIHMVWAPMCLAALTTPINTASSHVFAKVLSEALTQNPQAATWWFSRVDLSRLIPLPAKQLIENNGGAVYTRHRAVELIYHNGQVHGIHTNHGQFFGHVVLATPFHVTQQLLAPVAPNLAQDLSKLRYESITTIYLYYPNRHLPAPMIGLNHGLGQWVFDRSFANQPGLMAVIISGNGEHLSLEKNLLAQTIIRELDQLWGFGMPTLYKVIHEKRGAFSAHVDCQKLRPNQITQVKGLSLAGDYTKLPYPSTLEGAVLSGTICANHLIRCQDESTNTISLSLSA